MKHTNFKRLFTAALLLCFVAVLLAGCTQGEISNKETEPGSSKPAEQDKITLRVAVEASIAGTVDDGLHSFLRRLQSNFTLTHGDVEIVIEKIPKEDGREEVLQRLRAELMVGEGPDILLLPTLPTDNRDFFGFPEPLIPDVQQAMRNGLFLDISTYYDADAELDKAALNQDIMDAGLLDGARYVLPLCYDLPVVYVSKAAFAESGVSKDIFSYGAVDFLNAVAQFEDLADVGSFRHNYGIGAPLSFNFFPELIDYDTGEVSVTPEELASYLQAWQAYRVQFGKAIDAGYSTSGVTDVQSCYGRGMGEFPDIYWGIDGCFASCESLLSAADNVLLARSHGVELDMYPLRSMDGSVVADVTFYGAVSSGCKHPELAYEFLRHFLSMDFQHEPTKLDFYGWPVRTAESVAPRVEYVGIPHVLTTEGMRIINTENVTDAEMPILNISIDHVRFSILPEVNFGEAVSDLYSSRDQMAVETDFEAEAEDWVKILQNHADEG